MRILQYRGSWGFDKCSLSGVMGTKAHLEGIKEKVWGK